MKIYMLVLRLFVYVCLMIVTVGCGVISEVAPLPSPTMETLVPTAKKTTPFLTATQAPWQQTAEPVNEEELIIPTISPTSVQPMAAPSPLNLDGPWLLLTKGTYYNGPFPIIDPIVMNIDGTAWRPLNLPRPLDVDPNQPVWWYGGPASDEHFLVLHQYMNEYFPDLACEKKVPSPTPQDPNDAYLYILKLPENEVINKILLLGWQAKQEIYKENCTLVEGEGIPPVIGVTFLPYGYEWSEDGRYLLFQAAPDSSAADLYIYDFATNKFRRLTTRKNNPEILSWSMDQQTIIYEDVTKIDWYGRQVLESSGLYVVSFSGTERLVYKLHGLAHGIEWLSQSEFIFSDWFCDSITGRCASDAILMNINSGKLTTIHKGSPNSAVSGIDYVTDPIHHHLLLIDPPAEMPGAEAGKPELDINGQKTGYVEGIFDYDLDSRSLTPVMLENLPDDIRWSNEDDAFRLTYVDEAHTHWTFVYLQFVQGQGYQVVRQEKKTTIYDGIDRSPDGMWSIGKLGSDYYILDKDDRPVQIVMKEWGTWAPDASLYYQLAEIPNSKETVFSIYSKEKNWQNTFTRVLPDGVQWGIMWLSP